MAIDTKRKNKAYGINNALQKLSPLPIIANRKPTITDKNFSVGQIWIDQPNNDSYILTSITNNQANWQPTSSNTAGSAPISKYIVDGDGSAGYITIQSAIDAANAAGGGMVYVRPGIYSENLTCYDKTQVIGAVGIGDTGDLIIDGIHTPPLSGSFTFRNIKLQSSTDIFYSIAAGNATLTLIDCTVNITNGYTFNLIQWTGTLVGFDLTDVSINNGGINNIAGATIFLTNLTIGAGTLNNFITTGSTTLYNCIIDCPVEFKGGTTGVASGGCQFKKQIVFTTTAKMDIYNSLLGPVSSGALINHLGSNEIILSDVTIDTPASVPIVGITGIIRIGNVNFPNSVGQNSPTLFIRNSSSSLFGSLKIVEGSNATMGIATLVAGAVTVNTTRVTANSRIQLTHQTISGAPGWAGVSARVPGTSFTITSQNPADTSTIAWLIIEPQ